MADRPPEIRSRPGPPIKGRAWHPKYPDLAVPLPQGKIPEGDATADQGAEPWTAAPESSHLLEFRFWDRRRYSFIRRFGPYHGASQLQVRFKAKGNRPVGDYTYFITSGPEAGKRIFDDMAESDSPGTVLKARVEGVFPYQPTADLPNR